VAVARYYFHLADQRETIPDDEGIEITGMAEAYKLVLQTVEELRAESPSMAAEWRGWELEVADASGVVVFSISLDEPLCDSPICHLFH
jgi:hypothetical protein